MHISGPWRFKITTKIPREDPLREEERMNIVVGEGKKAQNFGSPRPSGPPPFGAPQFGAAPSADTLVNRLLLNRLISPLAQAEKSGLNRSGLNRSGLNRSIWLETVLA